MKHNAIPVKKIISGGQTGADRAALDFALENDFECGGWCPAGRLAEDGRIDEKYPLSEASSDDYNERTKLNILASDATIVFFTKIDKGTLFTIETAQQTGKPFLKVDLNIPIPINEIRHWLNTQWVKTLNVAGPRESNDPDIFTETLLALKSIFLNNI